MSSPWPDFYKMKPVPDRVFQVYKEHFAYDRTDLDIRIESRQETSEEWTREKVSFAAAYGGERVPAYLYLPKNTKPPYHTVIFWSTLAAILTRSSNDIDTSWDFPLFVSFIVKSGRAVMIPLMKGMFERGNDSLTAFMYKSWDGGGGHQYAELLTQQVKDFRRSIDYLETRKDIDTGRLAFYGVSLGVGYGAYVPAVDSRLKASVLVAGGMHPMVFPEANQVNFLGRVQIPTLMLCGRYGAVWVYETSLKPMFDLLGTPARDKQLKLYDTDSVPPKTEIIKETLAWLDRYLGPVRR
jgi:dienelactone hydrolase